MGFDCHESSVKFRVKRGAGVVANEGTEGCIRSSRATAVEAVTEKASPANSLTCPCKPFIDGATTEF